MAKRHSSKCNALWSVLGLFVIAAGILAFLTQRSLPVENGHDVNRSRIQSSVAVQRNEQPAVNIGVAGDAESDTAFRPVVLALALKYPLRVFQNFLLPLRTVYTGDVILFVDDKLDAPIASWLGSLSGVHTRSAVQVNATETHHQTYRYFLYSHACRAPYTHCFLTDFRDVYFQADPFVGVKALRVDLIFQEECGPTQIKDSVFNSNWVKSCYGNDRASEIMHINVVCSGTIMGTPRGIQTLYDVMAKARAAATEKCNCKGCDQGLVNGMVHLQLLPKTVTYTIQPMRTGIVNTLGPCRFGYQNASFIPFLRHRVDGTLAPVLHQHDRMKLLNNVIKKELSSLLKG